MAAAPRSPAALPPGARTMEDVGLRHWLPHYFPVLRWLPSYNVSAQRAPPVPVGVVTGEGSQKRPLGNLRPYFPFIF